MVLSGHVNDSSSDKSNENEKLNWKNCKPGTQISKLSSSDIIYF